MQRIVVVGGGIGGLAAAWGAWSKLAALDRPEACEVVLLEREAHVGGKARTVLPAKKAVHYLQIESKLRALVRYKQAASVPVAKDK